jgi:hypothetical protein
MVEEKDIEEAFLVCAKRKRRTVGYMRFDMEYFENIVSITESINNMTYHPSTSICFVVTRPKLREIFAAEFYDRVVHTWVALRLEPLMEQVFNDRTFNCRKGKGQLLGVKTLASDIKELSENYTKDCYIGKVDIKGFFMSIPKQQMADLIDDFIVKHYKDETDKESLRYVCRELILHDPSKDCIKKGKLKLFDLLPKHKSLLKKDDGCGFAIGNLFVQLFANLYLNRLDRIIESSTPYHVRYVDDIVFLTGTKEEVFCIIRAIRKELSRIGLSLNESKSYIQHYSKGVDFTGAFIKPGREYIGNRSVGGFVNAIHKANNAKTTEEFIHAVGSINSYLGMMKHYASYAIRRKYLSLLNHNFYKYAYIGRNFGVVHLKREYRKRFVLGHNQSVECFLYG